MGVKSHRNTAACHPSSVQHLGWHHFLGDCMSPTLPSRMQCTGRNGREKLYTMQHARLRLRDR
eukprot:6211904-Pleurochrysis_carterae.AAC.5